MTMLRACIVMLFFMVLCPRSNYAQWSYSGGPEVVRFLSMTSGYGYLFVGTDGTGVFRSSDDGDTWQNTSENLPNLYVEAVAMYGAEVLAGTRDGVFRSYYNGDSWLESSTGLPDRWVVSLEVVGSAVFAGTQTQGVFKSIDGGITWAPANQGMVPGSTFVWDILAMGDTLFAGTWQHGVYRSTDEGGSWIPIGLDTIEVKSLAQVSGVLCAGTWGGGVFRSTDRGGTWTAVNNGLARRHIRNLSAGEQGLYAATGGGWPEGERGWGQVFVTTDFGDNWNDVSLTLQESGDVIPVAVVGTQVFAGVEDYGLFRSTDGGSSWLKSQGFGELTVQAFVELDGITLAGTRTAGVFRPFEWSSSWEPVNEGLACATIRSFTITEHGILVGTGGGGAFRTTDYGDTWEPIGQGILEPDVHVFHTAGSTVFAGTYAGVFKSTNGGLNWSAARSGIETEEVWGLSESGGVLFAATWSNGVFRSSDDGGTWSPCSNGLPPFSIHTLQSVGTILLVGTDGSGVFRSTDGGDSWTAANAGLTSLFILSLTTDGDIVYATTDGEGIFQSADGGTSWLRLSQGLAELYVVGFGVAPDRLMAGPLNAGAWFHPRVGVMSPGAGVIWTVGKPHTVRWGTSGLTGNVTIRLSTDGGSTFPLDPAVNTANDGSETIIIPDNPSTNCRIRVQSATNPAVFWDSPGSFTITRPITVGSPAAGATWTAGTQQTVTWTSRDVPGNVTIRLSTDGGSTFPVDLAVNTPNDGDEACSIPDNPSPTCRIRVESVTNPLWYGDNPGNFVIIETTPPLLGNPSVTGGMSGQTLTVSTQITDNSGVAGATLFYRKGGDAAFSNVMMSGAGAMYQGSVPAIAVTGNGVDYYIRASDIHGNASKLPGAGWFSVQVSVPGEGLVRTAAQPGGSVQTDYRLVSIPFEPDRNDVASILEDDLGAYNDSDWRLLEMRPDQSYGDMSPGARMTAGKAFWLIVRQAGKVIDTGPGKSVSTATPYVIPLHAQWNLVGSPYNFPIPVTNLTLGSGGPVVLRSYEGAWNNPVSNPVSAIEPFGGYALQVSGATTLAVSGNLSVGPLPRPGTVVQNPADDSLSATRFVSPASLEVSSSVSRASREPSSSRMKWWVGIEARCDEARDVDNVAMVANGSQRSLDGYDISEPPVIGEYVSVRFPHPEWGEDGGDYCVDARPPVQGAEAWTFEVTTARSGQVSLVFTNVATVPEEYQVVLFDEAVRVQQDLRKDPAYTFESGGEGSGRRYSMIVGTEEAVRGEIAARGGFPETFSLLPNFPNPFNPVTTIVFALPARADVSLRVYSLLGQEISVLHDGVMEAGYRSVEFDARGLSSGTYLVMLKAESMDNSTVFTGVRRILLLK